MALPEGDGDLRILRRSNEMRSTAAKVESSSNPRSKRVLSRRSGPGGQGGDVRVHDDDLVAESFEAAGHPLAVGRRLDQDPRPGPIAEHRREARGLGVDPPLDQLALLGEDADLAFLLMHVHANMVQGWPLLLRR